MPTGSRIHTCHPCLAAPTHTHTQESCLTERRGMLPPEYEHMQRLLRHHVDLLPRRHNTIMMRPTRKQAGSQGLGEAVAEEALGFSNPAHQVLQIPYRQVR